MFPAAVMMTIAVRALDNLMTIEGNQIAIENGFLALSQENNSINGK
jgi:hypothetical protein|tara:strand:- start:1213 stop:1350 length:138 start_codon:yes stop_codon:yes gene_type:complete